VLLFDDLGSIPSMPSSLRFVALIMSLFLASSNAFIVNLFRLSHERAVRVSSSPALTPGGEKEALRLHVFDILQTNTPWAYEEAIRAEVCPDVATRLVRWHISGPGSEEGTLAVEAVTFDADYRNTE
jgi:hypothetical protein